MTASPLAREIRGFLPLNPQLLRESLTGESQIRPQPADLRFSRIVHGAPGIREFEDSGTRVRRKFDSESPQKYPRIRSSRGEGVRGMWAGIGEGGKRVCEASFVFVFLYENGIVNVVSLLLGEREVMHIHVSS